MNRARWVAAAWLLALVWQSAAAQGGAPFIVGVGRSINDPPAAMDAIRTLGVHSMRVDAPWAEIETAPGRYSIPAWLDAAVDAARAADVEPLLILAYGHPIHGGDKPRTPAARIAFTRYAIHVVRHFAGRVRYFDLWNEWNTSTGRTTPGTADDYVALARQVYPAIKAENPDSILLSGGITSAGLRDGWLERFIELGGLRLVDGLSVHPYNYQQEAENAPERAIAVLDRVHAATVAAGTPLPIYVTEMGYPAYAGRGGVTREVAALYLARFMLLAATRDYVAGVWWYCLRDQGNGDLRNKEHHFGVLDRTLHPKPAADALRAVAVLAADAGRFRAAGTGSVERIEAARRDGSTLALEWNPYDSDPELLRALDLIAPRPNAPRVMSR